MIEKKGEVRIKLHFVTGGGPDACREETGQGCDVLVFGFSALGEVDYRSELDGTSQKLESLALLSRRLNCVAVAGCVTLSCGFRRRSAVVAERGKLLGVSDQLYTQGEQLHCGAHLKVYPTAAGKLGICVGEDLFFPQVAQALSLFDADAVISVFGQEREETPRLMLRASAFCAGVPVCMCADGVAQVASWKGELLFRSAKRESDYELSLSREYRIYSRRLRGGSGSD